MKIFIIGGTTVDREYDEYHDEIEVLHATMPSLGQKLLNRGHEILICSPFQGSADFEIVSGTCQSNSIKTHSIEFHYPEIEDVKEEIKKLCTKLSLTPSLFPYSAPEPFTYSWLLAQLRALDRSHAVIAVGGKPDKSANLLLLLAEGRRNAVLPLTFLGGAAALSFQRRRYELGDRLGEEYIHLLGEQNSIHEIVPLIERLVSELSTPSGKKKPNNFFISYARNRPAEADFVEMTLRRRNYSVIRDERDFSAGHSITREISENIYRTDVFVTLWSQEYACSPWCFDELDLALKLNQEGRLQLWLLCLDETRMVPPMARKLVNYPARTREELEDRILTLLEHLEMIQSKKTT